MSDFTPADKIKHLVDFEQALIKLIDFIQSHPDIPFAANGFKENLIQARSISQIEFTQADLNALSRSFVPVIYTHPHWEVPYKSVWFTKEFEEVHEEAVRAAENLRIIGKY